MLMTVTYNLSLIIHFSSDAINSHEQSKRSSIVLLHVGILKVTIKAFWSTFIDLVVRKIFCILA